MTVTSLLGGRYRFIKMLGSDSSDGTYLVGDTYLEGHPKCVIKRLPLSSRSPKAIKFILLLLRKKAESLKHVGTHDQVPKILAYFEEKDSFYLVEEFIPGRPLSEMLKPQQRWSEALVLQFLQECLKILIVVHGWGVIHRCIRPSNIIQRQSDGKLILTGFGVFRDISAQDSRNPQSSDRPHVKSHTVYTAMEQLKGDRHSNADIYSVGMIGIQALTGLPPAELAKLRNKGWFNGNGSTPANGMNWHQYVEASPALVAVLDQMIQDNPKQRFQTAAEALSALLKLDNPRVAMVTQDSTASPPSMAPPPPPHLAPPSTNGSTAGVPPQSAPPTPPMAVTDAEFHSLHAQPAPQPRATTFPVAPRSWRPWGIGIAVLGGIALALLMARVPQKTIAQFQRSQGEQDLAQNRHQDAINHFSRALQLHPTGETYLQRGQAHQQNQDLRAAQDDFSKAIQLDPTQDQAYFNRGNLRYQLGDRQGALEDYTEAIAQNPTAIKAYVNRGSVRGDRGDEAGAIEDYSAAIQLDPSLSSAYLNRCLSRSNLADHKGAIADCTQAINLDPTSVLAYQNRGLARRRLGDTNGALNDLNIAINLDPDDPDPYYNRGLTRLELGDRLGAMDDYTAAINRNPDHALAYYDRGLIRVDMGDTREAIADFRISSKLCLNAGRRGCYDDAQYQLSLLGPESEMGVELETGAGLEAEIQPEAEIEAGLAGDRDRSNANGPELDDAELRTELNETASDGTRFNSDDGTDHRSEELR